jgi:hypothetical protein
VWVANAFKARAVRLVVYMAPAASLDA